MSRECKDREFSLTRNMVFQGQVERVFRNIWKGVMGSKEVRT